MDRLDVIVNGSETATATTDNGPVPSIAKLQQDILGKFVLPLDFADITGLQAALDGKPNASALAATNGSGGTLLKVKSAIPTSPAVIDANVLASRRADVRDWSGMDLTGTNDCTSLIQNAVDQSAGAGVVLHAPSGIIALTAPIVVPTGTVIEGASGMFMSAAKTARTHFFLAHTGRGFIVSGFNTKAAFRHFGTQRNQPTLASGWAPQGNDWDFDLSGVGDVSLEDILLLNPTKGIVCRNGGGRHSFDRVWGQPLTVGIQIDEALDVIRMSNIHFWNFWSENQVGETHVINWTVNNATSIYSKRNDNPQLNRIFSLFYRHGLRIGSLSGLTTRRMQVTSYGADHCGSALTIDNDANGATVEIHGFYGHGNGSIITNGSLIDVKGTNSEVRIVGKADLEDAHLFGINVQGAGSAVIVDDLVVNGYNRANNNYTALDISSAAYRLTINNTSTIFNGTGGTPATYAATDKIWGLERDYTPTIAPGTGAWTGSASSVVAKYKIQEGFCQVQFGFTQPTNNTGASSILMGLPVAAQSGSLGGEGIGREVAINGNLFQVAITPGATVAGLLTPTNGYPGVTNGQFRGSFRYRVA